MTSLTTTQFDGAFKDIFIPGYVQELTYKKNVLLALMPKARDFYGRQDVFSVRVSDPQGVSADFSKASNNKTPSTYAQFKVTRVRRYGLYDIDNETIEASEQDVGAFIKAQAGELAGIIRQVSHDINIGLFGDQSARLGQVSSFTTGSGASYVLTLTNATDTLKFEKNMVLTFGSGSDGSNVKNNGTTQCTLTVSNVDRSIGVTPTVTVTGASGSSSQQSLVANDYLFRQGNQNTDIAGLLAWIPTASPTSTAFFNIDRTVDVTRYAGSRFNYASYPIRSAITRAARALQAEAEGDPDICIVNPATYAALEDSLGDRVRYVDVATEYPNIGFKGIEVSNGAGGMIAVVQDRDCPAKTGWLLQLDTWILRSLGDVPHLLNRDGTMIRNSGADSYEVRVGFYGNLFCVEPVKNAVIQFSA